MPSGTRFFLFAGKTGKASRRADDACGNGITSSGSGGVRSTYQLSDALFFQGFQNVVSASPTRRW